VLCFEPILAEGTRSSGRGETGFRGRIRVDAYQLLPLDTSVALGASPFGVPVISPDQLNSLRPAARLGRGATARVSHSFCRPTSRETTGKRVKEPERENLQPLRWQTNRDGSDHGPQLAQRAQRDHLADAISHIQLRQIGRDRPPNVPRPAMDSTPSTRTPSVPI
jgi:hypothetical protein